MAEMLVRRALHTHVMSEVAGAQTTIDELWVPRSNERADVAVIGTSMDGFETKTERDTLKRLPRQIVAYGRLFDRCTAVVAERHRAGAEEMLPGWWGIVVVEIDRPVIGFRRTREACPNPAPDSEFLVRLLWRDEVIKALVALGGTPQPTARRGPLWRELLRLASLTQLRDVVRWALLARDRGTAAARSRRLITAP